MTKEEWDKQLFERLKASKLARWSGNCGKPGIRSDRMGIV